MTACIDFQAVVEEFLDAHPASNVYFLLDHGGLPGLHRQLLRSSAEWVSLFDGTQEMNALAVAPILVLGGRSGQLQMSRSVFEWIGEHGTYTSSVIILVSPLKIDLLRLRLAARLNVRLPEDMDAMLRFFDPRVFEGLTKILSAEQAAQFFGIAEAWKYVNRDGILVNAPSCFEYQDEVHGALQLSQEQENSLLEESEIDQVLGILDKNMPQSIRKLSASKKFEVIGKVVRMARKEGLESIFKISLCVAVVAIKGESFGTERCLGRLMADLRQNDCDFSEMLSLIELDGTGGYG